MKKILALFILSFVLLAFLQAKSVKASEVSDYLESYVSNGLISFYSGTYNTKNGHTDSTTKWENLVGDNSINLSTDSDNKFIDDAFHLKSKKQYFTELEKNTVNGNEFSLEFYISDLSPYGKDFNTFINSSNDNFALFRRVSTDVLEFKFAGVGQSSRPTINNAIDKISESLITITYKVSGKVRIYINGQLKAEKIVSSLMGANDLFFGYDDSSRNFEADFKLFRFYNRELTSTEVKDNAMADNMYGDNITEARYNTVALGKTNIIGGINAIRRVNSYEELDSTMVQENLPQALIYKIDKDLKLILTDNNVTYIKDTFDITHDTIIPVYEVTSYEIADALISFIKKDRCYDSFVLSTDPNIVKYIRSKISTVYGVIDYQEALKNNETLSKDDMIQIRESMHQNYGTVAILPVRLCSHANVQYLYDSIVNVWAEVTSKSDGDLYQGIASGAIGVVTDNTGVLIDIANVDFNENSMTRLPLNIGHRGIPKVAPENTIEGARLAYELGADVIELDIYLTTDNKIVVMHDDNTSRTCDKKLTVETSTLQQLKELYVNKGFENNQNYNKCRIPTLEEYLIEFKDKDIRLFIEVKSSKESIIPLTKELIDKYEMYDQISFISFNASQLDNLNKNYPGSTTGLLLYNILDEVDSEQDIQDVMKSIGKLNSTLNPNMAGYGKLSINASLSRGIAIYPWTFNTKEDYTEYMLYGYSGLTGNDCRVLSDYAKSLKVSLENKDYVVGDTVSFNVDLVKYDKSLTNINDNITIKLIDYNRNDTILGNTITFKKKGNVEVIISYEYQIDDNTSYTIYSDVIKINVLQNAPVEPINETKDNGCSSIISTSILTLIISGFGLSISIKKRQDY